MPIGFDINVNNQALAKLALELKSNQLVNAGVVDRLVSQANARLRAETITMSIQEGINHLKAILLSQLRDPNENFDEKLTAWIESYRQLENAATATLQARVRASRSINDTLAVGADASFVWGTETDIISLLGDTITPDTRATFESGKTYILAPRPLVTATDEARMGVPGADVALIDHIQPIINSGQNVTVCIPVTAGQSHWRLLVLTIGDHHVTAAELIDSVKNVDLKTTLAYKTVQMVVDHFKDPATAIPVTVTTTGKQKDGFSCMDYTVQAALQRRAGSDDSKSLLAIRNAKGSTELRQAVIRRLNENYLEPIARRIFTPDNTQVDLHTALTRLQGRDKNLQIEFDELLAKAFSGKSDKDFDVAWEEARKEIRKRYNIEDPAFTPSPSPRRGG